ncbi:hypothetical protein HanIR_Chr02g0061571 [Helianthus annuus]|nr:hypothetical protein HanIR_Chr02g0061571 [Helianthus annuus]
MVFCVVGTCTLGFLFVTFAAEDRCPLRCTCPKPYISSFFSSWLYVTIPPPQSDGKETGGEVAKKSTWIPGCLISLLLQTPVITHQETRFRFPLPSSKFTLDVY